jgi:hypothetical protein
MLVTQTSAKETNSLISSLFTAINKDSVQSQAPTTAEADATSGNDSATHITISAEAQQRLARDKAAAEKLAGAVASDNIKAKSEDTSSDLPFDSLFDTALQNIPNRKSESDDGLLKALPDDHLRTSMREVSIKLWTGAVERKNPEAAAAFKEALANGTAHIRMASDVPGANARTSVTYFDNRQGMQTSMSGANSPEIQEMLDAGKALMTWKHGVGDLFITW